MFDEIAEERPPRGQHDGAVRCPGPSTGAAVVHGYHRRPEPKAL